MEQVFVNQSKDEECESALTWLYYTYLNRYSDRSQFTTIIFDFINHFIGPFFLENLVMIIVPTLDALPQQPPPVGLCWSPLKGRKIILE